MSGTERFDRQAATVARKGARAYPIFLATGRAPA